SDTNVAFRSENVLFCQLITIVFLVPSEKPGFCPKPKRNFLDPICLSQCSRDNDCDGILKCCFDGCGHVCKWPTGLCPSPGDYGICDHACSSDQDCKGDDKCCPTTCGTICEPPVINKPGVCPSVKSGVQIYICVSQCISGSDCNGNLKCGSNGCGHTCLEPVISKTLFS
uniref:WAP domain-containing protein n=1 Tax=Periophthalmus magnuspinnatus TaxID=409849 RepID=A0A3B3ZGN5_9GOBI